MLFDWDDTIVSSQKSVEALLTQSLQELNMDPKLIYSDLFEKHFHMSILDAFPRIFGSKWKAVMHKYHQHFAEKHLEYLELIPNAKNFLDVLLRNNITMAIVSNKPGYHLRREVTYLGLNKYFHSIIGASDAAKNKPSPEPAYKALQGTKHNFGMDHMWFIGDSIADLECGTHAKCLPILFHGHKYAPAQAKSKHAMVQAKVKNIRHNTARNYQTL